MASENRKEKHLSGYLNILESHGLVKTSKKRWFVLGTKSRFVYFYKTPRDTTPAGKIDIGSAVFSMDPNHPCLFQIRSGNDVITIEVPDAKSRLKWLQALQDRRRTWCDSVGAGENSSADDNSMVPVPDLNDFLTANYSSVDDVSPKSIVSSTTPTEAQCDKNSVFYLNEKGELHEKSLVCADAPLLSDEVRKEKASAGGDSVKSVISLRKKRDSSIDSPIARPQSVSIDAAMDKVAKIFRMSSQQSKKTCENCVELISVVQNLKERCMDFNDEIAAQKMLVESLRGNLLASKNQVNVLQHMFEIKDNDDEKIKYVMEAESQRTYLHLQNTQQRKEINDLKEKYKIIEHDYLLKSNELDAYKDSIKSKDEMIMKLVDEQTEAAKSGRTTSNTAEAAIEDLLEFNGAIGGDVYGEVVVNDVSESQVENLKDLLRGYETQNKFLNKEILELHNVVQSLEAREDRMAKKNFELEAEYYQLKSRYLLLLNHFQPNKELEPTVVSELLKDAKEAVLLPFGASKNINITDDLGFYLATTSKNVTKYKESFIDAAGQLKKVSDEITQKQKKEASEQYLSWLTQWDSLLVNYTDKTLSPCPELKELVRFGIPHAYRARVWKCIVSWWVKEVVTEVGSGYFDCLYRKALSKNASDVYDPAMKQIDLDLTRTLPHNKFFEDLQASKIESLRRVLYSFRWHNTEIGYCQGLNRLAAVALLFLNEEDSFWTLVAIVDHLQPKDYYGHTMLAAQADQRVLRDLVLDKMPKIASHLKNLEVDLSLFTFNWFLTVFVDSFVHQTYLNVWDSFLYEGNKVLFRFALATLKLNENEILACKTSSTLHAFFSQIGETVTNFEKLSQIAFKDLNPFPSKMIESRRAFHSAQLKAEIGKINGNSS